MLLAWWARWCTGQWPRVPGYISAIRSRVAANLNGMLCSLACSWYSCTPVTVNDVCSQRLSNTAELSVSSIVNVTPLAWWVWCTWQRPCVSCYVGAIRSCVTAHLHSATTAAACAASRTWCWPCVSCYVGTVRSRVSTHLDGTTAAATCRSSGHINRSVWKLQHICSMHLTSKFIWIPHYIPRSRRAPPPKLNATMCMYVAGARRRSQPRDVINQPD